MEHVFQRIAITVLLAVVALLPLMGCSAKTPAAVPARTTQTSGPGIGDGQTDPVYVNPNAYTAPAKQNVPQYNQQIDQTQKQADQLGGGKP
jgi:hypothetical protein